MKLQPLLIPVLGFMSASYTQDVSVTPGAQSKAVAPVIQAELGPQDQPQVEIQYASAPGLETCLPGCALDVSLPSTDNGLSAPQPELADEAQSFADLSTASGPNFFSGDSGLSLGATSLKLQSRQNEISTAFNASNFDTGGGRPSSGAIGSPSSSSDGSAGSGSGSTSSEGQSNSDQNASNQNSSGSANSGAGGAGTSSGNGKGGGAQGDGASANGANGNDNGSSQDKPDNASGEYGLPSDIPTSGQPQNNDHKPPTGDSVPPSSGPQQGTSPSSDDPGKGSGNPQGDPRNPALPSKPGDEPGTATPGTGGSGAQPVPEPASFTLLGSGLLAGWMLRRRRGARKEA